jgi:hypothetical protein
MMKSHEDLGDYMERVRQMSAKRLQLLEEWAR